MRGNLAAILAPLAAFAATIVAGAALFAILGEPPLEALRIIFIEPLTDAFSRSELAVKAAPLILIATGLSLGFRAGIWNIGAEGQFTIGALAGGAVGLALYPMEGIWVLPLMALAGAAGGALWALIPALLKTRFGASEILVSLMLVYVATLLLSALVSGPLRDPDGFNFPESRLFHDSATLPILISGTRVHLGVVVAVIAVLLAEIALAFHVFGFELRLAGLSPKAAAFAGVNPRALTVRTFLISGALAGMAGLFEAAGPVGQLVPALPQGYGFTAIIVAFLGRLRPLGILAAGLVLALTYIGGERAQLALGLPAASISVFQGMLLFFLLAFDALFRGRLKWTR